MSNDDHNNNEYISDQSTWALLNNDKFMISVNRTT